jgi:hypothetical protein
MSDFLANLLARATGTAESIRPRPISHFEPSAPLPNLPPQETLPSEDEASESVSAPLARKVEPTSRVETAQTLPDPPREPSLDPIRIVRPAIPDSGRPSGDLGRSAKPLSKEVVDAVMLEPAIPSRTSPETWPSAKTTQIHPLQDETRATPPPQTVRETRTIVREVNKTEASSEVAPSKPLQSHVSPVASTGVAPVQANPLREPALSEPPAPVPPMIPRVPQAATRQMTPAPAEPVIHVTIGRIEVRALPQENSAKQRRASSTVMSLDEYLGSRKKAGAR